MFNMGHSDLLCSFENILFLTPSPLQGIPKFYVPGLSVEEGYQARRVSRTLKRFNHKFITSRLGERVNFTKDNFSTFLSLNVFCIFFII